MWRSPFSAVLEHAPRGTVSVIPVVPVEPSATPRGVSRRLPRTSRPEFAGRN